MLFENKKSIKSYRSVKDSNFLFSPKTLFIEDDGFHSSDVPRFTEWWYFDAILDYGFSIHMSIRVKSFIKNRFVRISEKFTVYKNGELIGFEKKNYSLKNSKLNKKYPQIILDKKKVVKGKINDYGKWIYSININVENISADLTFEGNKLGWKGFNPGGDGWVVVLPKANVKGMLKIDDEKFIVEGVGYHDHNFDVRASVIKDNNGWVWGKINSKNFTATWAVIFDRNDLGQPILVLNDSQNNIINIHPKYVDFVGTNLKMKNGKLIPYNLHLKVNSEDVVLDISMDVSNVHYERKMFIMRYWRFHLVCKGFITINDKSEKIDKIHIAEFVRFR
jgi:hypothetical protein